MWLKSCIYEFCGFFIVNVLAILVESKNLLVISQVARKTFEIKDWR